MGWIEVVDQELAKWKSAIDEPCFIPLRTDTVKAEKQNLYLLLHKGPKLKPQKDEDEDHLAEWAIDGIETLLGVPMVEK